MTTESIARFSRTDAPDIEELDAQDWTVFGRADPKRNVGPVYVRVGGDEFRLKGVSRFGNTPASGDVLLRRREKREGERAGQWYLENVSHVAQRVPAGTFDIEVQRHAKVKRRRLERQQRATSPRLIDLADLHPLLDGQAADLSRLPASRPDDSLGGLLAAAVMRPRSEDAVVRRLASASKPAARGIDAILERLAEHGVTFELVGERLAVRTTKGMGPELRALVADFAELIEAKLRGEPLTCAFPHDEIVEAWTLALPRLPVCRGHLEGGYPTVNGVRG